MEKENKKVMKKKLKQKTEETIGMPELKPGENVELTGMGEQFSGQYHIEEVTHTISDSGYSETFNKRKEKPVQE